MFAIVESSGRQFELVPGRFIDIDMTGEDEGAVHKFDRVLMLVDGDKATVGQPYVKGAVVTGKVISKLEVNEVHGRMQSSIKATKIIVYHMKPKKGTRKKQGHRSQFTRVFIDAIELDGKVVAKAEAAAKEAKEPKAAKAEAKKETKPAVKKEAKAAKA
ncbi:MAG: 50S ribosomal protein L21 [Cyanobacteria bacterium SZAS LIN-3]|nr:50S ribosomal protein L21 [Cyanobacteria bacterium SZAS LIN-3]